MGSHVVPPKAHIVGQPRVDVTDECICNEGSLRIVVFDLFCRVWHNGTKYCNDGL